MRLCVFGSGSAGNCIYVGSDRSSILIDLGLPVKRIEKCLKVLGVEPSSVSVLITHEHSDHVRSLGQFVDKYGCPVYAHAASYPGISASIDVAKPNYVWFEGGSFFVGEMTVTPFEVSHDVPCVGYRIEYMDKRIAVATDIGKVTQSALRALTGCELVVLESNHDLRLLQENKRYPEYLKRRIMSTRGHLSNSDCADCVLGLASCGTKQVVLAHLSEHNNCPELAFETVKDRLISGGFTEGEDVRIEVAEQDRISALFELA